MTKRTNLQNKVWINPEFNIDHLISSVMDLILATWATNLIHSGMHSNGLEWLTTSTLHGSGNMAS